MPVFDEMSDMEAFNLGDAVGSSFTRFVHFTGSSRFHPCFNAGMASVARYWTHSSKAFQSR